MKPLCLYNKKELNKVDYCVCFHCMADFGKEDLYESYSEELECPFCRKSTVLPMENVQEIDLYWIYRIQEVLYG